MGQTADEVRREIERTRSEMSGTIDAIGDRVSPRRVVERRTQRMRDGFRSVRESVMGTADDATSRVGDGASSMAGSVSGAAGSAMSSVGDAAADAVDTLRDTPQVARRQTQGNPIAAGLIAFGGGLLLASVLPKTELEQQAAASAQPAMDSVKQTVSEAGREMKDNLSSSASDAADSVKQKASEATEQVKSEAQSAAGDVKEQAQGATHSLRDEASSSADSVQSALPRQ